MPTSYTAGDRQPKELTRLMDRLGVSWELHGHAWFIQGVTSHPATWDYLVNNRAPLLGVVE